jgi:hypothetical protein
VPPASDDSNGEPPPLMGPTVGRQGYMTTKGGTTAALRGIVGLRGRRVARIRARRR